MDAISKIHDFLRFGSVLGLERMNTLLEKLGDPQDDLRVIHVAGTNGKGSVCRYMCRALQEAGYRTGLYTSPFLEVFHERIELNGKYISNEDLEHYTDRVLEKAEKMVTEGCESPTEFEVVTAIALLYFREKGADYVILEVGLGGRGDSTNVVKRPLASVITSISLDHTDRLGSTVGEIAGEKAGIIKSGCPVVVSTDREDAMCVIRKKAEDMGAPLYDVQEIPCRIIEESLEGTRFSAIVDGKTYEMQISMLGRHQVSNALTALATLLLLRDEGKLTLSDEAIKEGFRQAKQIGRMEILRTDPPVLIDGAHNPDGARALKEAAVTLFPEKRVLMTIGVLADKDIDGILDSFFAVTTDYVVTEPDNPRKMPADELAERIRKRGGRCMVAASTEEAVKEALARSKDYDLLLFAGSLYMIGKIRRLLCESGKNGDEKGKEGNSVL